MSFGRRYGQFDVPKGASCSCISNSYLCLNLLVPNLQRCACLDTPAVKEQHPGGLDALIEEGGQNWSTGQRQLICLARAVLRNPLILAIDEATANIDYENDKLIQTMLRTNPKFVNSTMITIAHRIDTIDFY